MLLFHFLFFSKSARHTVRSFLGCNLILGKYILRPYGPYASKSVVLYQDTTKIWEKERKWAIFHHINMVLLPNYRYCTVMKILAWNRYTTLIRSSDGEGSLGNNEGGKFNEHKMLPLVDCLPSDGERRSLFIYIDFLMPLLLAFI